MQGAKEYEASLTAFQKAFKLEEKGEFLFQQVISNQYLGRNKRALEIMEQYLARKGLQCREDDFQGPCARYNGIKLVIQMEAEAARQD